MQLWFLMLLAGMVFAGVGNFISKIASMRAYEAGRFTVIGTALSVPILAILLLFYSTVSDVPWWMLAVGFFGGTLGGVNTVVKIKALDYIDTTIYFPLFKLLSPVLAIMVGVSVWGERFSTIEWIGIILSLLVPLLLITPSENRRQNNLKLGLIFVLISSGLGAGGAVIMKYMSDYIPDALLLLFVTTCGVSVGGLLVILYKKGFSTLRISYWKRPQVEVLWSLARAFFMALTVYLTYYAYVLGAPLTIVQVVYSLYILIPIALSVWFYDEHLDLKKFIAIVLSVVALGLLG